MAWQAASQGGVVSAVTVADPPAAGPVVAAPAAVAIPTGARASPITNMQVAAACTVGRPMGRLYDSPPSSGHPHSQAKRPASRARARRSPWGRAPTWEITSAADTPPSRAAWSGASPLVMP